MNDNWWELPEMSAGQVAQFMDWIRNLNENPALYFGVALNPILPTNQP